MKEHKSEILRIFIAVFLLAAVALADRLTALPRWSVPLFYAVPYLIAGGEVLLDAAKGLLHGEWLDECFLMTAATLGAFAVGEYPEAVFVMLFFEIGELFEDVATDHSRRSVAALTAIRPDKATLETPDGLRTVDPAEVAVGDIITVAAGERIPLDGTVASGTAAIDTSALTGESLPAGVSEGDRVYSGTVDLNGLLRIRVTGTAAESTAAKILELTQNAMEHKAKSERFITRFARIYTPVVIGLAVLLAVLPGLITGRFAVWFYRACMFLVVSCPCALVISVPLGWFCGIGGASGKGILIKGADALERLAAVKTVVFDKTGTLTAGTFSVTGVYPHGCGEQTLLQTAALAENFSSHPAAAAFRNACPGLHPDGRVTDAEEIAGCGVRALADGKEVLVGNARLMRRFGTEPPVCDAAGTVVHVRIAGAYAGAIVISDQPKPESAAAIAALRRAGIRTVMLTGDREEAAGQTAETLGIDEYRAELMPADKVEYMEKLLAARQDGEAVAFVGDGINDAPVLARADLGIAMGALGADAAIEAADVVLMHDRVDALPTAFAVSRKTNRIVRQNIVFSIAVKAAVLILAAFGLTGMWFAAFADVGVLVLAVLNAVRCGVPPHAIRQVAPAGNPYRAAVRN